MARVTPMITTHDGRQMRLSLCHPARYNREHLDIFSQLVNRESIRLGRTVRVLDPMCGVGSIHDIAGPDVETVGSELELPFVAVAQQLFPDRMTVQGDAAALSFPDGAFDAVVVSPDYGSRLADSHVAKDPCRCRKVLNGSGVVIDVRSEPERGCKVCHGTGRSLRRSYTEDLRRLTGDDSYKLTNGSSAGSYAWQPAYWANQEKYWTEALRVLRPGGLLAIDMKDVVRTVKGKRIVMPITDGHRRIVDSLGFTFEATVPLAAPGLRYGANHDLRVNKHVVLLARRPIETNGCEQW